MITGSKKGNAILDTIVLVVVVFAFVLIAYVGKVVLTDTNAEFQSDPDMSNESKESIADVNSKYANIMDYAFLTLFILIWALMLVASFNVDAHPIFFIFTIILMLGVLALSVFLGNAYEEIASEGFSDVYNSFPIAHFIMSNLLKVVLAVGFSTSLVLFAKNMKQ